MAVKGRLACAAPPLRMRRAGTAYWSPADLNWNPVEVLPDEFTETPILFVAGLNSFMLLFEFVAFVPGFNSIDVFVNVYHPITETYLETPLAFTIAASMNPIITFGAFGTGNDNTAPPIEPAAGNGLVWWLMSITMTESSFIMPATVRVSLLAGTR